MFFLITFICKKSITVISPLSIGISPQLMLHFLKIFHQVYSKRWDLLVTCPTLVSSSTSNPIDNDLHFPIVLHKNKHQCSYSISFLVHYDHLSLSSCSFITSLDSISLPKTIHEALSDPNWHEMMNTLNVKGTWNLVALRQRNKGNRCKWAMKMNPNRFVSWLKACLVPKVIHKHTGNRLL